MNDIQNVSYDIEVIKEMEQSNEIKMPGQGGSIELLDFMGNDLTVVNAARTSMAKQKKVFNENDARLIRYLLKHSHLIPFAHVQFQFRLKMPIFIARQWFKHQIGLVKSEVSRRYVTDEPEFWYPDAWRKKAENVKQGSSDEEIMVDNGVIQQYYEYSRHLYNSLLEQGVCPEQARAVLPQAMITTFVETGSLLAYLRIISLRDDAHAQKEIQYYAKTIEKLISDKVPVIMATYKELREKESFYV